MTAFIKAPSSAVKHLESDGRSCQSIGPQQQQSSIPSINFGASHEALEHESEDSLGPATTPKSIDEVLLSPNPSAPELSVESALYPIPNVKRKRVESQQTISDSSEIKAKAVRTTDSKELLSK